MINRMIGLIGASFGGWIGWWLGHGIGMMTGFMLGVIGSGLGYYLLCRLVRDLFE